MFDHYEWFKNEVYRLTQIDLNYYKEKQMRRRIDTLAKKKKGFFLVNIHLSEVCQ